MTHLNPTPPKWPKGEPPQFHDDANVDRLMQMVVALTTRVAVLRERLDAHERLAEGGAPAPAQVDAYHPDPAIAAQRQAQRKRLIARVFRPVVENAARRAETERYETLAVQIDQSAGGARVG